MKAFDAMDAGQTAPVRVALARGSDPVLNKVLTAYLMAQPGNDYSFADMASFISKNPDWPGLRNIVMIAEQKIPQGADPRQVVNWFNAYAPETSMGFYRYIDSLEALGQTRIAETLVRNHWIESDFCSSDLKAYQARYAPVLSRKDHAARLDRLLWDNNESAARAMFPYINKDSQALAEARLAMANDRGNVDALVDKVPSSLQRDPGLLYERLRWRRAHGNDQGAIDILMEAPQTLIRPDKWWKEKHIIIRRLMEDKNFVLAYRLAARHDTNSGFEFAQAEFLAGWLALRFLNRPDLAEHHFHRLVEGTNAPISQARGYYWLGRTYEALNRKHEAEQTYESAAALNTTYYGQLAITRLYAAPTIFATPEPPIPTNVRTQFLGQDRIQAIEKLYNYKQRRRAETYFRAALDKETARVSFALLLDMAYRLNRPDWAVIAAKAANQKNFVIRGEAYPVLSQSLPRQPEPALTHALIRQESQFNAEARSGAGAHGLMQLMPATAKTVAKRLGLRHRQEKMSDPSYNIKLGTHFIQRQIDNFGGSYIMALAGYNAGPSRIKEWIELFGDPRRGEIDPIDWIELIPIYETRNYVQRIIENLQFYRSRLTGRPVPLKILEDLQR